MERVALGQIPALATPVEGREVRRLDPVGTEDGAKLGAVLIAVVQMLSIPMAQHIIKEADKLSRQ